MREALQEPVRNAGAAEALRRHWQLYIFEGLELAAFMLSACIFTVLLFDPSLPAVQLIPSPAVRRLLMGIAMGLTAVLIIHSPPGKRSGAHFNPAITISYFRLGKIRGWDAIFYVVFQFCGGIFGVGVSAMILGSRIAVPAVNYAITVPGPAGTEAAFLAELFMSVVLMGVVLCTANQPSLAIYTSYLVGVLIALYILFFAPISGFSINPARTTGSAVFADVWTAGWLYFVAPPLGMLTSTEIYRFAFGPGRILCAKLNLDPAYPCPFICQYPSHRHR